jgi:hypothetical protein
MTRVICNIITKYIKLTYPQSFIWEDALQITFYVTYVTRRVSHVEQELLTLPEHLSSTPVLSGIRVSRSLVFCVVFVYRFLFFSFVLFLLGIVSSVRLQFTDMDYPFVILNSVICLRAMLFYWSCTTKHISHIHYGTCSNEPVCLR